MGFTGENVSKAREIISSRRQKAFADSNARLREVTEKIPELKEIDSAFPVIGEKIVSLVTSGGDRSEVRKKIDALKKESEELEEARSACLTAAGYPSDYTNPVFYCNKCKDTGYVGQDMCECMRIELVKMGYESSGLGALIGKQRFENFSSDFYSGEDKLIMEQNFIICKKYADSFDTSSPSLIFVGNTGLGKTHLSTSIAETVINKGFDVVYETSQNLISVFSRERFGRGYDKVFESDRFFGCDLLIIDDFGTEEINQFSVSCFYNLINTRVNKGLPIIISTNLGRDEIRAKYTDRIASRLFGEFTVLFFPGKDVRMQKLMK